MWRYAWLLSDEVAGCEVELETKVAEDYAKFYKLREGLWVNACLA